MAVMKEVAMNRYRHSKTPLLAGLLAALAPAAWANPASLRVELSQTRLFSGGPGKVFVQVTVAGAPRAAGRRAPVNTAIVLDRSGSMAGSKLDHAKQAAIAAVERLSADDIVAVVAYDDEVRTLVPATRASDRREIVRAIQALTAGNRTALYAGVSRGAHEVRKFLAPERVNRVVLLSDGLANVGPSSPELLADLGASLAKEGISVSTVGLGLDYNEDLMTRLARAGEGNHAFVENPERLAAIFDREFGELLSVVAKDVEVEVECPPGVRPLRVLGREAEIAGRRAFVRLGQLGAGQERYVLLEAEVAPRAPGRAFEVASVSVRMAGLREGATRVSLSGRAGLAFTASNADAEASVQKAIMVSVVEQVGNENNKRALALRDEGKLRDAALAMESNTAYLSSNASRLGSEKLEKQSARTKDAARSLDDASWRKKRKEMREEQHQVETQQMYGGSDEARKP
jgi:Ca-activated chloride channel family protein